MPLDTPITRRDFTQLSAGMIATGYLKLPHGGFAAAETSGAARWPGYSGAIVIDFLANPGPFNTVERLTSLTPEMVRNAAASGITAINVTVGGGGSVEDNFRTIGIWKREIAAHPDVFMKVRTVDELATAKKTGRLGLIYGFQDASVIGTDLSRVELFRSFGVRIIQLTYNLRNLMGDGCLEPANAGLSKLGHQLVEMLNDQRVMVDVSHCGQRTTADAIAASTQPVAISHSGCAALTDLPRNKRDEELRQIAEKGGVVGIYLMPFLAIGRAPTAEDVVRHIEHAVQVCGEDHVGIGSDLSITPHVADDAYRNTHRESILARQRAGISAPGEDPEIFIFVPDLNTPRRLETIADHLLARGHSENRVEMIIGANFLRLAKEVWGE
jgi:membrane dipeptidase